MSGEITLFSNEGRLFCSCTCGEVFAVSTRRALEQGNIACDCGARVSVDVAIVKRLEAEMWFWMKKDTVKARTIKLLSNRGLLFGTCSCGSEMAVPAKRALEQGHVTCECGTKVTVDHDVVEALKAKELRLRDRSPLSSI